MDTAPRFAPLPTEPERLRPIRGLAHRNDPARPRVASRREAWAALILSFLLTTGCAVTPSPGPAAAPAGKGVNSVVALGGAYWRPEVKGRLKYATGALSGTNLDLRDDLGLESPTQALYFQGMVRLGEDWSLGAEYLDLDLSGDSLLANDIAWGGSVFPADFDLDTDFEVSTFHLKAGRRLAGGSDWAVDLTGGVLSLEGETDLTGRSRPPLPPATLSDSKDWRIWSPSLGLDFSADLGEGARIFLGGCGAWMRWGENEAGWWDARLEAIYGPLPGVELFTGYRHIAVSAESGGGDVDFSLRLSGPVVGVRIRF